MPPSWHVSQACGGEGDEADQEQKLERAPEGAQHGDE